MRRTSTPKASYTKQDKTWIKAKLRTSAQSADSWPYTPLFKEFIDEFNADRLIKFSNTEFWQLVLAVRKQGINRKVPATQVSGPPLDRSTTDSLRKLLPKHRGEVDKLPYTKNFESIAEAFRNQNGIKLSNSEIWLCALRIAKAGIRSSARPLLEKATGLLKRSIADFNSFEANSRNDSVIVFLHWSLEMLLKSALLQRGRKIDDPAKPHHSIGFSTAVDWALTIDGCRFLESDDAQLLRAMNAVRGDCYHACLELDEAELYMYSKGCVDAFDRILSTVFDLKLCDLLPVRVLPVSTVPMNDILVLLDRKVQHVYSLLKAGETRRANSAVRSLVILDRAVGGAQDPAASSNDAANVLTKLRRGTDSKTCFPNIPSINLTVPGDAPEFSLSLKGKKGPPVSGNVVNDQLPTVAYRELDPRTTHALTHTNLAKRCGVSTSVLIGIIRELKLQERKECCLMQGPATGGNPQPGYSAKAVEVIEGFIRVYDGNLIDLYRKHVVKKKRVGK